MIGEPSKHFHESSIKSTRMVYVLLFFSFGAMLIMWPGGVLLQLSPRSHVVEMVPPLYSAVLRFLRSQLPMLNLRSHLLLGIPGDGSIPLRTKVTSFDYVVVSQRRYWALSRASTPFNSSVAVRTSEDSISVGELLDIIVLDQEKIGYHVFGHVRWLVPLSINTVDTFWPSSWVLLLVLLMSWNWQCYCRPHLGVSFWEPDRYQGPDDIGPGTLISLTNIVSHVVRSSVTVNDKPCWISITMNEVCLCYFIYFLPPDKQSL